MGCELEMGKRAVCPDRPHGALIGNKPASLRVGQHECSGTAGRAGFDARRGDLPPGRFAVRLRQIRRSRAVSAAGSAWLRCCLGECSGACLPASSPRTAALQVGVAGAVVDPQLPQMLRAPDLPATVDAANGDLVEIVDTADVIRANTG